MQLASWLLLAVGKTTAILLAACAADSALRRASAATRHFIWALTFMALLLLPLFEFARPWTPTGFVVGVANSVNTKLTPSNADMPYGLLLLAAYAAGVGVCWIRLASSIRAASRIADRSRPVTLTAAVEAREMEAAMAPSVWCSRLLVPPGFAEWPQSRQEAVLIHETAHIERLDGFTMLAAGVIGGLYWFHPLVWFALRRLRVEQERACDDAVLRAGIPASRYAEDLLAVAAVLRPMAGVPGATASLSVRVRSLLAENRSRNPLQRRSLAWAVAAALVCFAPIASLRAGDEHPYRVGNGVSAPVLLEKVEPQYTQEARDAKIEGIVVAEIQIDAEGNVRETEIRTGLDPGLDRNALEALRQWKFRPGTKDGKPVLIAATVEIHFKLQ